MTIALGTLQPRLIRLVSVVWRAEVAVWVGLYRFVFRRIPVPPGSRAFGSHRPILSIMIVFIVLSAVEIPIIDLIVHPWPWLRIPLLILGIWGLTWMLGFTLGYLTSPHTVGPSGIIVRQGAGISVSLSWDDVAAVSRSRDVSEQAPRVRAEPHGATAAFRMQHETNVLIELERPVTVRLSGENVPVQAIRLWVDDLDGFLDAVRADIP